MCMLHTVFGVCLENQSHQGLLGVQAGDTAKLRHGAVLQKTQTWEEDGEADLSTAWTPL